MYKHVHGCFTHFVMLVFDIILGIFSYQVSVVSLCVCNDSEFTVAVTKEYT